jgi:hypothetical protein
MEGARISRRRLLKSAGAGAVVLGAGSIMSAPAFGNGGQPFDVCTQASADNDVAACGACANQTVCGDGCGCVPVTNGCCFCHQGISCDGAITCRNSSQCPSGWKCAAATCCGPFAICVPPCGGVRSLRGAGLSTPA